MRGKYLVLPACLAIGLSAPSVSSAHIGSQFNSVHFHSGGGVDFGRVPRRARTLGTSDDRHIDGYGEEPRRIGIELEDKEALEPQREANRLRLLRDADTKLRLGQWSNARTMYREAIRRFGPTGAVRDRIELMDRLLLEHNPPAERKQLVAAYADVVPVASEESRFARDYGAVLGKIAADPKAGFLAEHALYQWASFSYARTDYGQAVSIYRQQLNRFPHSAKTEAGLIMLARSALLPANPAEQHVAAGIQALESLDRRFPRSRFHRAAIGLWGRALFLHRKYRRALDRYYAIDDMYSVEIVRRAMPASSVPADLPARLLAGYLRRLASANSLHDYSVTLHDIDRVRSEFGPKDARIFSRLVRTDLTLPGPYFYYRLYHTETKPKEITHLAGLARKIVDAHPHVRLPALVLVRFGEIDYFRKRYRQAAAWCDRAIRADQDTTEATPRAMFVRGASMGKMHNFARGIADFETLLRKYPASPLRRGAHEEAAVLYEAAGDLAKALDHYFDLGYQADIAFFLDGRMSVAEVESYLKTRAERRYNDEAFYDYYSRRSRMEPSLSTHQLITYSLGVRYMRTAQWDRAAHLLRQLPVAVYNRYSRGRREWEGKPSPDPLTAVRQMSRLHSAISLARTPDEKAAAMYKCASYYYGHGTLLFYSPPLWNNEREIHFEEYWNAEHATRKDRIELVRYMREHETYGHALRMYEEVARLYPNSPYAPKALYRAACAASRQSRFNNWWRERDKDFGFRVRASRLMGAMARRYPNHPLAAEAKKFEGIFAVAYKEY